MRTFFQLGDVRHFRRTKGVQFDIRVQRFQLTKKRYIKIKSQVGVMTTLQQQLVAPVLNGFFDFLFIRINVGNIRFFMPGYPVKITELTVGDTYVRGIYVAIDLPGHFSMRHLLAAQRIGHIHQFGQCSIFKKKNAFIFSQKIKRKCFMVEVVYMHNGGLCNTLQKYIHYVVNSTACMRKLFLSIYFIPLFLSAGAQEILPQPEARLITSFPFRQFSGGVMVIHARFGDVPDSLNFILDTGSGGISLDSATCAEFNIAVRASDTSITGIGGVRKVPFVFDQKLHVPGLTVEHLNFHVNDYEVLSSVYGEKVDGIIGYSFFSRYIVRVDFDSNRIEVYKPGSFSYPKEGTLLHPAFTNLPIQWLQVKDRKRQGFNFYFDTGAGLCLLLSEQFAKDSGILLSKRRPVVTQAEGLGGKLQMRLTLIRELKVGPYKFRQVPTYLYKDDYNVTSYPFTGGLLGNDLLRRFNIVLNYPNREIHLSPNSHFDESFDYAYTGLGIYLVNGKIMVEDVISGSPADKAHFKVNDQVVAVDRNFSQNMQVYKAILQRPNEMVKVLVKRENGDLKELTLYTAKIH